MKIFVNATAATGVGGLKTIVDEFISSIYSHDSINEYYIFVNPHYSSREKPDNCYFIKIDAKKMYKRLYWDYFGMKIWSKNNGIKPDKIISLQNTGVLFKGIEQIIYLHTSLPFVNFNWNILKQNERALWFYKNVYIYFIKFTINQNTFIVVQGKWLKDKVSESLKISKDRIMVCVPCGNNHMKLNNINTDFSDNNEEIYFYPAADYKYKNHMILIEALRILKNEHHKIYSRIKVVFTIDKNSYVYNLALKFGVEDKVSFVGKLDYKEMEQVYRKSKAVLFPSYIETLGLPLIEAALYGKSIYCSKEDFSKEVIGQYEGVEFIDTFNVNKWVETFLDEYKTYRGYNNNQYFESWPEFFNKIKGVN